MSPRPTPQTPENPLDRTEWDFSECPQAERRFCCYYEYLRSLEKVRALFVKHGAKNRMELAKDGSFILDELNALVTFPAEERKLGLGKQKNLFQPLLMLIADIPEFPLTPWLKLPPSKRTRIARSLPPLIRVCPEASQEQLQDLAESRRSHSDVWPEIVSYLRMPLGMTLDDIIEAFTLEMTTFAKDNPKNFKILKGGRGGYIDRLRQLGAWRLLQAMKEIEACAYTQKVLGGGYNNNLGLYSQGEMAKAAKKAERFLDSLLSGR